MRVDTSALCDIYLDQVDVVEPIFSSFGGASSLVKLLPLNALKATG